MKIPEFQDLLEMHSEYLLPGRTLLVLPATNLRLDSTLLTYLLYVLTLESYIVRYSGVLRERERCEREVTKKFKL